MASKYYLFIFPERNYTHPVSLRLLHREAVCLFNAHVCCFSSKAGEKFPYSINFMAIDYLMRLLFSFIHLICVRMCHVCLIARTCTFRLRLCGLRIWQKKLYTNNVSRYKHPWLA